MCFWKQWTFMSDLQKILSLASLTSYSTWLPPLFLKQRFDLKSKCYRLVPVTFWFQGHWQIWIDLNMNIFVLTTHHNKIWLCSWDIFQSVVASCCRTILRGPASFADPDSKRIPRSGRSQALPRQRCRTPGQPDGLGFWRSEKKSIKCKVLNIVKKTD